MASQGHPMRSTSEHSQSECGYSLGLFRIAVDPRACSTIRKYRAVIDDLLCIEDLVGSVIKDLKLISDPDDQKRMVRTPHQIVHDDEIHVAAFHSYGFQQLHLGDGIILTIAAAAAECFGCTGPTVGALPVLTIICEADMAVDPVIDSLDLHGARLTRCRFQHLGPWAGT